MASEFNPPFRDTITAPRAGGYNVAPVLLAPVSIPLRSRNADDFEKVEDGMVGTMQELRIGVVQRNQEFDEQLTAVRERAEAVRKELRNVITPAREADLKRQRQKISDEINALEVEISNTILKKFQSVFDLLPVQEARLDSVLSKETQFYTIDVPEKNEAQCGAAIRLMHDEREAMALDTQTIRAREKKISERLDAHVQNYLRRADAEVNDRKRQYDTYEALFTADTTAMQASHDRFQGIVTVELKNAVDLTKVEVEKRREGDSVFVATMSKAMAKIRQEALVNFGGGEEKDEEEEDEEEDSGKR